MPPDGSFVPYADEPANDWHRKVPSPGAGDYEWAAGALAAEREKLDLEVTFAWTLADKPVPKRRWIVEDWIPRQQVTLLTGEGEGGKSLIALQLVLAAASGPPWLDLDVEPVPCFGVFAEDDNVELHIRLAAVAKAAGVKIGDLRQLAWREAVVDPAELVEINDRGAVAETPYFHWLQRTVDELGSQLIVLDAATNLYGGDEIKRRQVNGFLVMLRQWAIRIDSAILLLAHPSAQGIATKTGLSGSTHWSNGVRSRLYFMQDEHIDGADHAPDARRLIRMKSNYEFHCLGCGVRGEAMDFVVKTKPLVIRAIRLLARLGLQLSFPSTRLNLIHVPAAGHRQARLAKDIRI
jgi:RecA-family ATPase